MIEMVTFHGEVDDDHEFFATLSGREIHRRYFMKEDSRGLHFFSQGNEIILTPEGVYYNCTGGQISEYMFGASLPLEDILMDMVGKTLPANTYAVFTHRGSLTKLGLTCQYIYGKWLPNSDYVLAGEYDFEHYDQRFQGTDNENTEFDIYVPVKATGSAGARRWPDGQRQRSPSL